MKIGSIVECVNNENPSNGRWFDIKPSLKQPYTVREIRHNAQGGGILLEEIINPINPSTGNEFGYMISRFRELLPPMEIQDALDSCEPVLIEL